MDLSKPLKGTNEDNATDDNQGSFFEMPIRSLNLNGQSFYNQLMPSFLQAPKLELKTLSGHLKYVYLGDEETLPVIIARDLTKEQEVRLIQVLKKHKTTIG